MTQMARQSALSTQGNGAIQRVQAENALATGWDNTQVSTIKNYLCKGITDPELTLFAEVCKRTGLDPFTKQIYAIKRANRRTGVDEMSIQTGIDGFRLIGHRTGKFDGMLGPFWCGPDGEWHDVWLGEDAPSAAKVAIKLKGVSDPIWGVALWREFCQYYDGKPSGQWGQKESVMIAKCAEAQAWRKACPAELGGVYEASEIDGDTVEVVSPIAQGHHSLPKRGRVVIDAKSPEADDVDPFAPGPGEEPADNSRPVKPSPQESGQDEVMPKKPGRKKAETTTPEKSPAEILTAAKAQMIRVWAAKAECTEAEATAGIENWLKQERVISTGLAGAKIEDMRILRDGIEADQIGFDDYMG